MRKLVLVLAAFAILAVTLVSCRSNKPICPAYKSQIKVEQPSKRV